MNQKLLEELRKHVRNADIMEHYLPFQCLVSVMEAHKQLKEIVSCLERHMNPTHLTMLNKKRNQIGLEKDIRTIENFIRQEVETSQGFRGVKIKKL